MIGKRAFLWAALLSYAATFGITGTAEAQKRGGGGGRGGGGHRSGGGGGHRSAGHNHSGGHRHSGGHHHHRGGVRHNHGGHRAHSAGHRHHGHHHHRHHHHHGYGYYPRSYFSVGFGYGYPYGYGYDYPFGYGYPYRGFGYYDDYYYPPDYPPYRYISPRALDDYYDRVDAYYPRRGQLAADVKYAVVQVFVPDPETEVWFEGHKTAASGSTERRFESPELDPGKTYTYTVKASWNENGKPVTEERKVDVSAGNLEVLIFGGQAEAQPAPPPSPSKIPPPP